MRLAGPIPRLSFAHVRQAHLQFSTALNALTGRGHLTEDNIADTVRQVRLALLDADVALPVVKTFTDAVKARAVGIEVTKASRRGRPSSKWCTRNWCASWASRARPQPARATSGGGHAGGLQGAGKTTTAGKLARWLIEKEKKKVLMVSTDVYRPAAILQLQTLASQVGAGFAKATLARPRLLSRSVH